MVNVSSMPDGLAEELVFSEEEIKELKLAREKPIVFDEFCHLSHLLQIYFPNCIE